MLLALIMLGLELLAMYTVGRMLSSRLLTWTLAQSGARRILGWAVMAPGTALHEASHALVALCLGGRISSFVPFKPVETEPGGWQLGYVEHSGVRLGPLGGALVGMAPLVGVPLCVWGLGLLMLPVSGSPVDLLHYAISHPLPFGLLWIVLAIPLSFGALPSPSDHRDLPLAGLILALLLGGLYLIGALSSLSLLESPLVGFAQLLILPGACSLVGVFFR